jgi:hypothetical protein
MEVALLLMFTGTFLLGVAFTLLWQRSTQPKHKHIQQPVSVGHYQSWLGPRTVVSYSCPEDGFKWSDNLEGHFPASSFGL